MVDIFLLRDGEIAIRQGLTEPIQHVEIEKIKNILKEASEYDTVSGGGAANVAKIAGLLGAGVSFTGALGKDDSGAESSDEYGRLFEKELSAAGVKLRLALKSSPTGICLYFKAGSETQIAASPSAAALLSEDDIDWDELEESKLLLIDGFTLNKTGLIRRLLGIAAGKGIITAIDLGSREIAKEMALSITEYVRQNPLILFMSEAEASAFYEGLGSPGEKEMEKETPPGTDRRSSDTRFRSACSYFRSFTKGEFYPVIVVKLGPRGALTFSSGNIHRAETTAVTPCESTGAGDTFCAAFLTAWLRNKSLHECTILGNKAARLILDVTGTGIDKTRMQSLSRQLNLS